MGGAAASGGSPGSGGDHASGGASGGGGVAAGADASVAADVTVVAGAAGSGVSGGGHPGVGGSIGTGAAPAAGGQPATGGVVGGGGGQTGLGGVSGVGGTATGGAPSTGGATGAVTFPAHFVGNIDTRGAIRSDFITYWDQFTPENAGKWPSVQGGSASTFNWTALDAMYKHCEDHGILFKEHTFLWGSNVPAWMGGLTTTTGPEVVQSWMKAFCERYPKTRLIDVVNEPPPHASSIIANAIGGGTNTTWDWVANAFKWARQACPNAVLILNDYQNIEDEPTIRRTIDIVAAIKKLGAPIDAIGCETHHAATLPASTLAANIDKLVAGTGLPIYITEYDINLADDSKQQQQYQDHFAMFMSNPNIMGVTVWGYIVGATWQANTGLMTSEGTMRPAMSWLMDVLGR